MEPFDKRARWKNLTTPFEQFALKSVRSFVKKIRKLNIGSGKTQIITQKSSINLSLLRTRFSTNPIQSNHFSLNTSSVLFLTTSS